MTPRPLAALTLVLAALALAACGEEQSGAPTTAEGGDRAAERAQQSAGRLAERTSALARQVAEAARELAEDPRAERPTAATLEGYADQARALEEQARRELPEGDPARDALAETNQRTARAAGRLSRFAETRDTASLEAARRALKEGAETAGRSADRLPPEARRQLEELERRVPELSVP